MRTLLRGPVAALATLLALAAIGSLPAAAQSADPLPAPADFLPAYARAFTPHHRLVDYFEAVAAASPRVALEPYGTTYEGRPLLVAYVSSADNIAGLEGLRQNHLRRSGITEARTPTRESAGAERAESLEGAKAVVWLSYSVHGNEAAGSEASAAVLYALASAGPGDSLAALLDDVVVVIDPSLNPDGYTRYTDGQRRRATLAPQPDPAAWEHVEPWPGGRTNHYLFDLNRDWAWATQAETRARLALYRRWMPHVHADVHEMGHESHYYFAPAAAPFHEYITPWQREFQTAIGRNHARAFDREGWLYFTREEYDLLYPSYGDTYPTFNGAIGMTYEQGGSGRAGRAIARAGGTDTLTLAERMAHHTAASLSTVATASRNAAPLARAMRDYFEAARRRPRGDYEAYVFPRAANAPGRLRALTALLDRHGIAYGPAARDATVAGVAYAPGAEVGSGRRVGAGDLVVPARQTQGTLAQVLLDPDVALADSLTYDITAWSLPFVNGLSGFATTERVGIRGDAAFALPEARTSPDEVPAFGFAVRPTALSDWIALAPLLHEGATPRYADRAREGSGGDVQGAGTLLFLRRDHSREAFAKTYHALRDAGVAVEELPGGIAAGGPDLGSNRVSLVTAPTVALLQADEARVNAFGHVWHFFERSLGYPVRPIPLARLNARALEDVDVAIVTDGRWDLGEGHVSTLRDWVRGGGRLIALEGGAEALMPHEGFALAEREEGPGIRKAAERADPMLPYADRERAELSGNVPGALVEAQVDLTHPLATGLSSPMYLLRTRDRAWGFLDGEAGYNVVGVREAPDVRGFVGQAARARLAETLAVGVQPLGRGSVVYAADNLAYRGFWEQGMQLLANAVFLR